MWRCGTLVAGIVGNLLFTQLPIPTEINTSKPPELDFGPTDARVVGAEDGGGRFVCDEPAAGACGRAPKMLKHAFRHLAFLTAALIAMRLLSSTAAAQSFGLS